MLPQDPFILLSMLNMHLRDGEDDLAGLCASLGAEQAELEDRLAAIGFHYDPEQNQFK